MNANDTIDSPGFALLLSLFDLGREGSEISFPRIAEHLREQDQSWSEARTAEMIDHLDRLDLVDAARLRLTLRGLVIAVAADTERMRQQERSYSSAA